MNTIFWPMLVYFIATIFIVSFMIVISYFLGERHRERATNEPYESGVTATGSARLRFNVKFYLVAMFFVIFDVESIFIFAWAIAFKETGWQGYIAILIFITILIAALIYLWRCGALSWSTSGMKKRPIIKKSDIYA